MKRLCFPVIALVGMAFMLGCVNKIMVEDFPKPITGEKCTVIIYRESVLAAGAQAFPITLDGRVIAQMRIDSRLELELKPGLRVVGSGSLNLPVMMEAGKTYYVSIDPSVNPCLTLKTKDEAWGRMVTTTVLATNRPGATPPS